MHTYYIYLQRYISTLSRSKTTGRRPREWGPNPYRYALIALSVLIRNSVRSSVRRRVFRPGLLTIHSGCRWHATAAF